MKNKKYLMPLVLLLVIISIFYLRDYLNKSVPNNGLKQQNLQTFQPDNASSTNKMEVIHAEPFNSGQYSKVPSLTEIGPNNVKILLRGPVVVTGEYSFINSEIGFSGYCMKDFNQEFLGTLPYGLSNKDIKIFCFKNGNLADSKLGRDTKRVSVIINNFELNSYPAEVMNWADLVEVKF